MPYRVVLYNGDEGVVVHSPINPDIRFTSGKIHQSAVEVDSFDFSFNQSNPADAYIKEQLTEIEVTNAETDVIEFEGRVRNRTGQTNSNSETTKRYSADDALIYLNDSTQYAFDFDGKPSALFNQLIDHHNEHVEPNKHFAVGRCEVDVYKVYVDVDESDDGDTVNIKLAVGDNATIKQTTRYIYDGNGTRLTINTAVLGVTHTVEQYAETGMQKGRYLLRHPSWGIIGWIDAVDIEETKTISGTASTVTMGTFNVAQATTSVYTPGTKVKIKRSATTYYWDSTGARPTPIADFVRDSVLTTREYSSTYERYAIYRNGDLVAWINASDLEGGASQPPSEIIETEGKWVTRTRTIKAEITYDDYTLDAIKEHLLRPFGAEMYWERIDGVRTVHIVNRRVNETDHRIAIGLNLISMQENFDPSGVVTRLVPRGKLEGDSESEITIESVNNGLKYIDNTFLVEHFGIKMGSEVFEDVDNAYDTMQRGYEYMGQQPLDYQEINLTKANLELIDMRYDAVLVGDVVDVQNPFMNLEPRLRISDRNIDIVNEISSDLVAGRRFEGLTDYIGRGL